MKLISFDKKEEKGEAVVSISKEEFEKKLNFVYNYQKRWFNVPGFRKGKVPRGIIESNYGHDIFYDGAMQELYVDLMNFLSGEKKEKFVNTKNGIFGRVPKDCSPSVLKVEDNSVDIKVPLDFYPHTYVKFKDMSVEIEKEKKASKEDIEEQKKKLFEKHSTFEIAPDDHKIVDGDFANVSLKVAFVDDEGNDLPDNEQYDIYTEGLNNFDVGVGSGRAWKEFEDSLIGHSKSEGKFSNILTFPENKKLDIFSGKRVRFDTSINSVKHLTPPSMEKLLKILKLESEKDLDSKVESDINKRNHLYFERGKEERIKKNLQDQISDDLVCKPLFDSKFSESLNRFERNLKSNGVSVDSYCEMTGTSYDSLKDEFKDLIMGELKLVIALFNVSENLGLSFEESEIEERFKNIAKSNGVSVKVVKENIPISHVYVVILCDKAMEYIKGHVLVKEPKKIESKSSKEKENIEKKNEEDGGLKSDSPKKSEVDGDKKEKAKKTKSKK